jgi:arabinogalactan oligomer/maltooligosaccharide transport system substrate-binding protein
MTFDGSLYGVPQRVETVALYYNKSLMPTPPTTTDELLQMAGEMSGPDQYGFGFISNFYHNAGFLYGFGGQIFDESGELALDSPETVEFVNFLKSVKDAPGVFTQADVGAVESLFREGKAASIINGPWFLQAAEEAIGAENVGVAPLPAISANEGAAPEPFLGVTGFYVNANLDDDQAALAAEFARWMASDGMAPLVEQAGYLPANTTVETPADDPIAQAFATQLESTVALPTDPRMGNVWTPAQDMITKVLEGQATAEEAVAEAAETIEQSG